MKARLAIVLFVLAAWAGGLGYRLYQLQIVRHEEYRQRAEGQHERQVVVKPPRGTIFDARGRELAVSMVADSFFAAPGEVTDPEGTARALAEVVDVDADRLARDLKEDRDFVWVARKLDFPVAKQVRGLDLPGIYSLAETKRYYPMSTLAAPLLGFVGTDDAGLEGLEAHLEKTISGEPRERVVLRDAYRGTLLDPDRSFLDVAPGDDVYLTIDTSVQYIVERELLAVVERYQAKGAVGLLLDPRTGAIVAMASVPSFDANRFADSPRSSWRNRAISDAYEPGSTFKAVTAAAAIEDRVMDSLDEIDCEMGGVNFGSIRINDHKRFGILTFRDVIAKSSNVGAIKLGLLVGRDSLHATIRDFGFGSATGIDLPGESSGIVHPVERWQRLSTAYISFGQEVSVTPLQLAVAYAAIANGGEVLRPFVVRSVGVNGSGRPLHDQPEVRGRPVSAATALTLERMLEAVVLEGTGKAAAVRGYRVAGKTGTAQKAVPGVGYSPDKFVASFVGFVPARDPVLVGVVVVDEPRGSIHGGEVAAPVFSKIMEQTLPYLGVRPDLREPDWWRDSPELEIPEPGQQQRPRLIADTHIERPSVSPASGGETQIPDLAGLTAREAVRESSRRGLRLEMIGHGQVARQEPAPGFPVAAVDGPIKVWLGATSF